MKFRKIVSVVGCPCFAGDTLQPTVIIRSAAVKDLTTFSRLGYFKIRIK